MTQTDELLEQHRNYDLGGDLPLERRKDGWRIYFRGIEAAFYADTKRMEMFPPFGTVREALVWLQTQSGIKVVDACRAKAAMTEASR